jgi:hypothetical protein
MNVEIGAEAAQFPEKEYINVIAFAVHLSKLAVMAWVNFIEMYIKCLIL